MALFNFLPKEEQYFSFFAQMTSHIYDASRALVEMFADKKGEYAEHGPARGGQGYRRITDLETASIPRSFQVTEGARSQSLGRIEILKPGPLDDLRNLWVRLDHPHGHPHRAGSHDG